MTSIIFKFLAPFVLLILISCSSETSTKEVFELSRWDYFSVNSPIKFREQISRDDGSVAWITYDPFNTHRIESDFAIYLYPVAESCLSDVTGSSEMMTVKDDIKLGKVDNRQSGPFKPFPNALCIIPQPADCTKQDYFEGGCEGDVAAYAFCAEKGEKKVLICISQITDNPDLAKQIFETFRWTDE